MQKDYLQRFIFDKADVRGETVHLEKSWQEIINHSHYPEIVRNYLAQMMAATVLLAATIKVDGSITIQASGDGLLNLMITECRHDLSIRAIAKYNEKGIEGLEHTLEAGELPKLNELLVNSSFIITVQQSNGQRYQGIVEVKGNSIAEILENHLATSEQIRTKIQLSHTENSCAGILLQELPNHHSDEETWNEISLLTETLSDDELNTLDTTTLVQRLFSEHSIRIFEAQGIQFRCTCSNDKVSKMLTSLGYQEAQSIIEQSDFIEVACEFCNKTYKYDEIAIAEIFAPQQNKNDTRSYH
ncbi:MAG: Hsp33 family molecular chaperone HslO [Gammaproteobacteria bacterium]|nr:Hsp33 family molecular chaperone HslO [Gammaproteobacteria bacterium]